MTAYVVRERTLPPHIRPDRPVVYDVTEAHTTRPTYYGVHTCPDRARVHALHLTQRARAAAQDTDVLDLGYAICDDLAAGMDPTSVVQSLQPSGEDTPISKVAAPLVGHADVYLCDTTE